MTLNFVVATISTKLSKLSRDPMFSGSGLGPFEQGAYSMPFPLYLNQFNSNGLECLYMSGSCTSSTFIWLFQNFEDSFSKNLEETILCVTFVRFCLDFERFCTELVRFSTRTRFFQTKFPKLSRFFYFFFYLGAALPTRFIWTF